MIQQTNNTIYLYELPQPSKIYLTDGMHVPDGSDHIIFHRPDGMYSYCTTPNKGDVIHLPAMAELIPYKDGYRFFNHKDNETES